jgi:methionyl-tRNA formyltransferase
MGTPELARVSLAALLESPTLEIAVVVTQPDRPKGRELKSQPSPVKALALEKHLSLLQPEKARDATFIAALRAQAPDLIVVAAYGRILPLDILELPRFGCLNIHTSLLPKYRGAAPIQRAILDGETETGVTIMKMDAGLDTGDLLAQRVTPILPEDDSQTLHDRLARIGAELLIETIPPWAAGQLKSKPQPTHGVSYAAKLRKEDGAIAWEQPAVTIWNRIRAFTPWPGAFTHLTAKSQPHLLKLWKAEVVATGGGAPGEVLQADKAGIVVRCGPGGLRILELQIEGRRRMTAAEFLAGHPLTAGLRLG